MFIYKEYNENNLLITYFNCLNLYQIFLNFNYYYIYWCLLFRLRDKGEIFQVTIVDARQQIEILSLLWIFDYSRMSTISYMDSHGEPKPPFTETGLYYLLLNYIINNSLKLEFYNDRCII